MYDGHTMKTTSVSASQFRQSMFDLYKKHLAPTAADPSELLVRDTKRGTDLFRVVPLTDTLTERGEQIEQYWNQILRVRAAIARRVKGS